MIASAYAVHAYAAMMHMGRGLMRIHAFVAWARYIVEYAYSSA